MSTDARAGLYRNQLPTSPISKWLENDRKLLSLNKVVGKTKEIGLLVIVIGNIEVFVAILPCVSALSMVVDRHLQTEICAGIINGNKLHPARLQNK